MKEKLPEIIQWLLDRLDTVETTEPENVLPKGAVVVGIMPENLRPLSCLRRALFYELKSAVEQGEKEIEAIDSRAEQKAAKERLAAEMNILNKKHEVIESLFWLGISVAFPELSNKPSIGFGEGWQVYWQQKDEEYQCEICTAMREAGLAIPGIGSVGVEVIEIPGGGLFGGLDGLLSRLGRGPKPGDSNEPETTDKPNDSNKSQETSESDESGEPQAASQPSTESHQD